MQVNYIVLIIFIIIISLNFKVSMKKSISKKKVWNIKQKHHFNNIGHHSPRVMQTINPNLISDYCQPESQLRVIGGEHAHHELFHYAAVFYLRHHAGHLVQWCGGSIIGRHHILTAGHCCFTSGNDSRNVEPSEVLVRVGAKDLRAPQVFEGGNRTTYQVQSIFIHHLYNSLHFYNDIAIMRVLHPITFTDLVYPVCINGLHVNYHIDDFNSNVMAGWGQIENGSQSMLLRYNRVFIYDFLNCEFKYNYTIATYKFCASVTQYDLGVSCNGDSGSGLIPLFDDYYPVNVLIGLLSGGGNRNHCDTPMIYVNVTTFALWINDNAN